MSAVAPLGERSMTASGTRAGVHTPGLDPQEDQLAAGLRPGDAGWGEGEVALLVGSDDERELATEPGAYERFYAGVRDALRGDAAMPVDARDSVAALRIIDAARRSARSATVIDTSEGVESSPRSGAQTVRPPCEHGGWDMKTSLGIWAMGPMVTRFNPGGYKPELAERSTADHVRVAVAGSKAHRRLRVPLSAGAVGRQPRRRPRRARRPWHLRDRVRPAPRQPLRARRTVLARRRDPRRGAES